MLQHALKGWAPSGSFVFVFVSNLIAVGAGLLLTLVLIPDSPRPKSPLLVVGLCLVAILAGMTASAMSRAISGLRRASENIAEQNRLIAEASTQLEVSTAQLREQVAQMLHGPVQGRLAAIALSLRLFVDGHHNGHAVSGDATFRRCRALLGQVIVDIEAIMNGGALDQESIEARVDHLANRWSGLIEVSYRMSPDALAAIETSPALPSHVMSVIEEAINNAVSHGRARSMSITVSAGPDNEIRVEAGDDGQSLVGEVVPGMGLRSIEGIGGVWSLRSASGGGVQFTVTLPAQSLATELDPESAAERSHVLLSDDVNVESQSQSSTDDSSRDGRSTVVRG
jgi:signal transduction histidine kinase